MFSKIFEQMFFAKNDELAAACDNFQFRKKCFDVFDITFVLTTKNLWADIGKFQC